jgi:ketosteroid isomerase-like protein
MLRVVDAPLVRGGPSELSILKSVALAMALLASSSAALPQTDVEALKRQVADTERSFARSMADRDHAAFTVFLSEQAVFFSGAKTLIGKTAVSAGWKRFFDEAAAPFSWQPDQVEVTSDGRLAMSTGPVYGPDGRPIARFNSVWRLEAPGTWRIVFDKGQPWEEGAKP